MFRVYKPKNIVRIKAVQVTQDNREDLAALLLGRVTTKAHENDVVEDGIEVATFEGVKRFVVGQWILRGDDNTLTVMNDKEFQNAYEVARNTAGG